jgi:diguanylate cyclase (GGDEF)-like protein
MGRSSRLVMLGGIFTTALATLVMLEHSARREAIEKARLVSAALIRRQGTDITEGIRELRERWPGLFGVAEIGESGTVTAVEPDWPEFRNAATAHAQTALHPHRCNVKLNGKVEKVVVVIVPLNDFGGATSSRMAVFLTPGSRTPAWLLTLSVVGGALAGLCHWEKRSVHAWMDKYVSHPLKALVGLTLLDKEKNGRHHEGYADAKEAIKNCPDEFNEVLRHLLETQAHARMAERQAQRQMDEQLTGMGRQLRRAEDRATSDALTGLRNRAFLEREFDNILQLHRGRGDDLAVVMIDVDNFKVHNDTRGHKAGDDVLRFLGDLLRGCIRPTDHAVRYGGDEFLLLLSGAGSTQARAIIDRIVKLFRQYAATLAKESSVSLSAGIATLKAHPHGDGPSLIIEADASLYRAKRLGKNAVVAESVV